MKKLILCTLLILSSSVVWSAGGSNVPLKEPNNDLTDISSLRRGAELFVNKCISCHSAKYIRYSVIAEHLLLSKKDMKIKLKMGDARILDHMGGGMAPSVAQAAFGVIPPDLTLSAKVRGTDWIYTYLLAYYQRPEGTIDNYVFPGSAMPNPFAGEQGTYKAMLSGDQTHIIGSEPAFPAYGGEAKLKQIEKEANFQTAVRDVTNFMEFISEPKKVERHNLGKWVMAFLILLLISAYLMKKEFWRDLKENPEKDTEADIK